MTLQPTDKQLKLFQRALQTRRDRPKPILLAVEDQSFSRNLLLGMLIGISPAHGAESAEQALELYCQHAPDFVFLDIELPDINGHDFATLLRTLDPASYVVMVTAHSGEQDVLRAKGNDVRGYIVKPYSKQKIEAIIEKFMQEWRRRRG